MPKWPQKPVFRICGKTPRIARGQFFFRFGTPVALGPTQGPEALVAACLLLLARRAGSTQGPQQFDKLAKVLCTILQLGGPNPNQEQR